MTGTDIPQESSMAADDKTLRVLSTSDVAGIHITLPDVVSVVEQAYHTLADGRSDNPRKLTVKPEDGHSVAYAMLGRDGVRGSSRSRPPTSTASTRTATSSTTTRR